MAQIIHFPKRLQKQSRKAGSPLPPLLPDRKSPAFEEAARRRLKAVIAHALAVLDQLEQEAS